MSAEAGQQHPLGIYLKIWVLLFVLSTLSYLVDYFNFQGLLRWTLIIIFMLLKAGFIIAIFMHVMWERMALILTILGPPVVLLFLIGFMVVEGGYTFGARVEHFGADPNAQPLPVTHIGGEHEGVSH
ncbi:MAG: cytochrome C oxidase subunit IV family protein [Pseudomonadales bacterium]|nr:cytochrome C oxidase subunit IV family protein [Pseudomonadales bacterium]MCP5330207.1 cytochrome C oxidase subunit IV family protein [Pseudomonadales bacterium]